MKDSGEPLRLIHGDLHQWNVRCSRGVLSPIDFEDLMLGWPVQDIATTLYYLQDEPGYPAMRAAFEQGYRRISPWPERYCGEIDAFIAGRGIGLLNFILNTGELLEVDLQDFAQRLENRLQALMENKPYSYRSVTTGFLAPEAADLYKAGSVIPAKARVVYISKE